jgi:hypothetical protein
MYYLILGGAGLTLVRVNTREGGRHGLLPSTSTFLLADFSPIPLKSRKNAHGIFLCSNPVLTLMATLTLRAAFTPTNLSFIKIHQDPHTAITAQMRSEVQQWAREALKLAAVFLPALTLIKKTHASCMVLEGPWEWNLSPTRNFLDGLVMSGTPPPLQSADMSHQLWCVTSSKVPGWNTLRWPSIDGQKAAFPGTNVVSHVPHSCSGKVTDAEARVVG